jgi:hypothetical protein
MSMRGWCTSCGGGRATGVAEFGRVLRMSRRRARKIAACLTLPVCGLVVVLVSTSFLARRLSWRQQSFTPLTVESTGDIVEYRRPTALFVATMPRPFGLRISSPRIGTVETAFKRAPGAPPSGESEEPRSIAQPMSWWPESGVDVVTWGAYRFRIGFPMPAFEFNQRAWKSIDGSNHFEYDGAALAGHSPSGYPVIFYRPVLTGFLVNWLASTATLWLIVRIVRDRVRFYKERRRKRRIARGMCAACGYASADLERCPECGTITPPASSSA